MIMGWKGGRTTESVASHFTSGHWHVDVADGEVVVWAWTRAPRSGKRMSGRMVGCRSVLNMES
jgi:hypothetical protein